MSIRILLIEDEENIRKIIAYDLLRAHYEITECEDGKQALAIGLKERFDVMIIDWMLPHIDGVTLVERFRGAGIDSIMIMLTARDDESDILKAFDAGVDDYITKPFSPRELLARISAHGKRLGKREQEGLDAGKVHISLRRREISIDKQPLTCTKKEFDLLEYLVRNQGMVLSRDQILNDIWGFDYDGDTRIVDVHIFKLRSKLNEADVTIRSSRGVGYILEVND